MQQSSLRREVVKSLDWARPAFKPFSVGMEFSVCLRLKGAVRAGAASAIWKNTCPF